MKGSRRLAALALVVVAGLAAPACGDDDDAGPTTTTTEPPTTEAPTTTAAPTTTTLLVSEEAVLAGNQAAWEAFTTAMNPPNPDHPALAATQSGLSHAAVRDFLRGLQTQNVRYETEFESNGRVVELTPTRSVVVDCLVGSYQSFRIDTGEMVETQNTRDGYQIVLIPENGVWKWSERIVDDAACSGS